MNAPKYQEDCFIICAILLLGAVGSVWIKVSASLRTSSEKKTGKWYLQIFLHFWNNKIPINHQIFHVYTFLGKYKTNFKDSNTESQGGESHRLNKIFLRLVKVLEENVKLSSTFKGNSNYYHQYKIKHNIPYICACIFKLLLLIGNILFKAVAKKGKRKTAIILKNRGVIAICEILYIRWFKAALISIMPTVRKSDAHVKARSSIFQAKKL